MRNNSVQFGKNILCVFDIFSKNYLDRRVRIMLFGVVCDSIEQYTPMFWLGANMSRNETESESDESDDSNDVGGPAHAAEDFTGW